MPLTCRRFPKYTPSSVVWELKLLHILTHSWYFALFEILVLLILLLIIILAL